jgi:hypothetical protein
LDAVAKAFIDRGSAIKLHGNSPVLPQPSVLAGSGYLVGQDFAKFYVTVGGAPKGRIRHLSWEELDAFKL